MGMFSTAIDAEGRRYQFKTGYDDDMGEYRIGDPVPYFRNPHVALEERWEDQITDGIKEDDKVEGPKWVWVVIKDHRVAALIPTATFVGHDPECEAPAQGQRQVLLEQYAIVPAQFEEWSEEAQAAYHAREAASSSRSAAYEAKMRARFGDNWQEEPGAFIRMRLTEPSLTRRILGLPQAEGVIDPYESGSFVADLAEIVMRFRAENAPLIDKMRASGNAKKFHDEVVKLFKGKIMRETKGKLNPTWVDSLAYMEFPHCS